MSASIGNGNFNTEITCTNIKIPIKVTSALTNLLVKTTDSSDVIRDQDNLVSLNDVIANDLSSVTSTFSKNKAGETGKLTIGFRNFNVIPANGKIVLTLPAGFDTSLVTYSSSSSNGIDGSIISSISNQVITLTRQNDGSVISASTAVSIVLDNLKHPTKSGATI